MNPTEEYIELNSLKHYLYIYGKDPVKPTLLFLHGGPGSTSSPIGYNLQAWAKRCNLVFYDQRGTARTRFANPRAIAALEDVLNDWDCTVEYITARFGGAPILLGHSWGHCPGNALCAGAARKSPQSHLCGIRRRSG